MDKGEEKEDPSKSLERSNKKKKIETTSSDKKKKKKKKKKKENVLAIHAGHGKNFFDMQAEFQNLEDLVAEIIEAEEGPKEETVLSPKESSTNNPKGMKQMNVEQEAENINQDEQLLSPKESSSNYPMGMKKKKRVRQEEEEEEEEEDNEKKFKGGGDSSSADTCTSKFPTSLNLDKGVRSPPGDQGSSC